MIDIFDMMICLKQIYIKVYYSNYRNEQADKLAYLGTKKPYVELNIPEPILKKKKTIKDYFKQ
jgi:hypothetical protein